MNSSGRTEGAARTGFTLVLEPWDLAIARLAPQDAAPSWATGAFVTVTRTPQELSVVCESRFVPAEVRAEREWCALRFTGPLDFALTGVIASVAVPLANAGISIFAISTFDTDYVLIRRPEVSRAIEVLTRAGFIVKDAGEMNR